MELMTSVMLAIFLLIWAGADLLFASGSRFKSRLLLFLTLLIISGSIYWILTLI
ncbi:MAG TPA: hypothetical protein VEZ13_09515 [Brevibacillus sp.]|nr:hypothetical protein [Brevibacillus sp.]